MNYRIIPAILILIAFAACNQGQNNRLIPDLERRSHDDSIKQQAVEEMKSILESKFALTDSANRIEQEVSALEHDLVNVKAEIAVQNDKLNKIKEFRLLRSSGKRESQIREAEIVINTLSNESIRLQNLILNLQIRLDNFNREIRNSSETDN